MKIKINKNEIAIGLYPEPKLSREDLRGSILTGNIIIPNLKWKIFFFDEGEHLVKLIKVILP